MDFFRRYDDFLFLGNLPILTKVTGIDIYDFDFRSSLECRSVVAEADQPILLRIGAIPDFAELTAALKTMGMQLLFTLEQHNQASFLENWYPLLAGLTPFSRVYNTFPPLEQLLQEFSFPVFIKGSRQTHGHKKSQCIIENTEMYQALQKEWAGDKRLFWQKVAIREFIPLQKIDDTSYPDMVPFSCEFRVFFWKNQLVGYGRYWWLGQSYTMPQQDKEAALALAQRAAELVDVPFLAVDIAKTQQSGWVVIEVNDGQESGYAGVNPVSLWQNILQVEQGLEPIV